MPGPETGAGRVTTGILEFSGNRSYDVSFSVGTLTMVQKIYSVQDARNLARRRVPRMMFDYLDGAAGSERANHLNQQTLDAIRLLPRVLVNVESRQLGKSFLGQQWGLPFGIAPMGMCNLTWPDADHALAAVAVEYNLPIALSTAGSSTIEATRERAGDNAWFQLYVGKSDELADDQIQRAADAGYQTLILTVDVPQVAPRLRDMKNGFQTPVRIGPRQFIDFALHPQWSIRTLLNGVPQPVNFSAKSGTEGFVRNAGRGRIDWDYLTRLRYLWTGNLIVKGVLSAEDARRIQSIGIDAIYVSNHGGRQLDSAPAAIQMLPLIRSAVGEDFPLLFDSGIRNGEGVIKALALGADFVMLGRSVMYGVGAAGQQGVSQVIEVLSNEISVALAQLGCPDINDLDHSVLVEQLLDR